MDSRKKKVKFVALILVTLFGILLTLLSISFAIVAIIVTIASKNIFLFIKVLYVIILSIEPILMLYILVTVLGDEWYPIYKDMLHKYIMSRQIDKSGFEREIYKK